MFFQLLKSTTKLRDKKLITILRPFISSSKNLDNKKVTDSSSDSSSSSSSSDSDSDDDHFKKNKNNSQAENKKLTSTHQYSKRKVNNIKDNTKLDFENISYEKRIEIATKSVAEILGGEIKKTENELIQKVKSKYPSISFSEMLVKMKSDQKTEENEKENSFSQELFGSRKYKSSINEYSKNNNAQSVRSNIFGKKLGLFAAPFNESNNNNLELWNKLYQRELNMSITYAPNNIFEEMISWTNRGMLWHFPIDNEQGLEEERSIKFYEHVFLEKHLNSWCPKKGPIRHFMELVCVGLSKNPYITVSAKIDHINWFKSYFTDKREILLDVGAIEKNELSI